MGGAFSSVGRGAGGGSGYYQPWLFMRESPFVRGFGRGTESWRATSRGCSRGPAFVLDRRLEKSPKHPPHLFWAGTYFLACADLYQPWLYILTLLAHVIPIYDSCEYLRTEPVQDHGQTRQEVSCQSGHICAIGAPRSQILRRSVALCHLLAPSWRYGDTPRRSRYCRGS